MTRPRLWWWRVKAAHREAMARVAFDAQPSPVTFQAFDRAAKYRENLRQGIPWLVGPR